MQYLFGNLIGWIVWLFFFFRRPDLRKEMIIMGLITAPLAFIDLYIVPRYWIPETIFNFPGGIEGLMFFFQVGGVSAVSYEYLKKKSLIKINKYHAPVLSIILLALMGLFLLLTGFALGLNPGIILIAFGVLSTLVLINTRKDLVESAIIGGLTFGGIYFATLVIWFWVFPDAKDWWVLEGIPRIFIFRVPLYEIVLGFITGAFMGNLYEFVFGYRYRTNK